MKGEDVGYVNKSLTLKLPSFLKAEPPSDVVHHSVALVREMMNTKALT